MKPCPFCGSDDIHLMSDTDEDRNFDTWVQVECRVCLARTAAFIVESRQAYAATVEQAKAAWNNRTE